MVIWDTQFTSALVYDLIGLSVSDSLSLSRQPESDTVISFLEARRRKFSQDRGKQGIFSDKRDNNPSANCLYISVPSKMEANLTALKIRKSPDENMFELHYLYRHGAINLVMHYADTQNLLLIDPFFFSILSDKLPDVKVKKKIGTGTPHFSPKKSKIYEF